MGWTHSSRLPSHVETYFLQTHALSLRRAVTGRRKPFDELLAEHKARVNCEKEQQQNQALKLQEQASQKAVDATTPKRSSSTSDASVSSAGSSRFAFTEFDFHVIKNNINFFPLIF